MKNDIKIYESKNGMRNFPVQKLTPALCFFLRKETEKNFYVVVAPKNVCHFSSKIFMSFSQIFLFRTFLLLGSQRAIFSGFYNRYSLIKIITDCSNYMRSLCRLTLNPRNIRKNLKEKKASNSGF